MPVSCSLALEGGGVQVQRLHPAFGSAARTIDQSINSEG